MKILPPDIQTKLQDQVLFEKQNLLNILKHRAFKIYNDAAKRTDNPTENKNFLNKL